MKAQEKEIAENSIRLLKSSAAFNQENKLSLPQRIHFLGIGGAGMTPLAGICLREGVQVSGSDKTPNQNQIELKDNGADIWSPHSLDELKGKKLPEVCVYSTAIPADNEEFQYLKENGVEFWHRSDLLQRIANQFEKQIVISGTHGKTTTTAMLVWILEKAGLKSGLKPCWVLGGLLNDLGSFGWSDQREVFVFEGDESDQSFLKSNPYIGLVTSLEPDHLENYNNSFDVQIDKFQEFAKKSQFFISTKECAGAQPSMTDEAIMGKEISLYNEQTALNGIIFGKHNRLNASAALKAYEIFISDRDNKSSQTPKAFIQSAIEYLKDFPGIYRRFELIGTTETGITVIDDYAHHPTEVRAAIKAGKDFLQEKGKSGKLIALFQPHLPTRLRDLWNEFINCFQEADELLINDLYVARGREIEGINSQNLIREIQKARSVIYCPGKPESLIEQTLKIVRQNDLVLILGAGDITNIRETLLDKLRLKDFSSLTSAASVNR